MMMNQPARYEPTLAERIVAYWAGTTTAVAFVMVTVSLSRAIIYTF